MYVTLSRARWVEDQMPHDGQGFARPGTMMPGMPERGFQRLSVELQLQNRGDAGNVFRGEEFSLASPGGTTYIPGGALIGTARLDKNQSLNTTLFYDVDVLEDTQNLRLIWRRGDETVYMPVPPIPPHYHAQPRGDVTWPPLVAVLLPLGREEWGETLYMTTFACVACHGDPEEPGSNTIGPHLGTIATDADTRQPDVPGMQYIYEAILDPNAFIAPRCQAELPCAAPSAMPDYSTLLALQEMADLLAYLAGQRG